MLMMHKLGMAKVYIFQHHQSFLSFFQGRMGRKGFPGKVGPEGVKVNQVINQKLLFFFAQNIENFDFS